MKLELLVPTLSADSVVYEGSMFTVAASAATILLFPNLRSRLVMVDLLVVRASLVFEDLDSRNGSLVERNGQRHIINATMLFG